MGGMMPQYTSLSLPSLEGSKFEIIDLRSDTVSHPTPAMRKAMFEAEVGDDVYGEDPTVNALETRVAKMFKKEAAIFLSTGTMGNATAVLAHCDKRGCEIIVGDQSHIFLYEQGGPAQLGGIHTRTIPNLPDGTYDLNLLETLIRGNDVHAPITALITVENTHNMCGGKVVSLDWLSQVNKVAEKYKIPVHMDGARIFNAAAYLGTDVSELCQYVDSVQFCFSKGLGAPIGSMLVGSFQLIQKARRLRKVLGGGMRQVGVIAAPCVVALDTMIDRLSEDHKRTRDTAKGIAACQSAAFEVDLNGLHSNILMIKLRPELIKAAQFCTRLAQVTKDEEDALGEDAVVVRVCPRNNEIVRLVIYWQITDAHVKQVVKKLEFISSELKSFQ